MGSHPCSASAQTDQGLPTAGALSRPAQHHDFLPWDTFPGPGPIRSEGLQCRRPGTVAHPSVLRPVQGLRWRLPSVPQLRTDSQSEGIARRLPLRPPSGYYQRRACYPPLHRGHREPGRHAGPEFPSKRFPGWGCSEGPRHRQWGPQVGTEGRSGPHGQWLTRAAGAFRGHLFTPWLR